MSVPQVSHTSTVSAALSGDQRQGVDVPNDDFDLFDLIDIINPLQHIPIVSTIYREITGDDIGHAARVVGGAVFGGVLGAASAMINVVIEASSGKDVGEHVVALFTEDHVDEVDVAATLQLDNSNIPVSSTIDLLAIHTHVQAIKNQHMQHMMDMYRQADS